MTWQQDYVNRYYPRSKGWIDGTTEFHRMCTDNIQQGSSILEIGAGPPNPTSQFISTIGHVVGADVDPKVKTNEHLTEAFILEGDALPFGDRSFDACVSNYVLEHVVNPEMHISEVARVLKPGGVYLFRTPNLFHYVSLVARATPHWFHRAVANRLRNIPPEGHDPYPTFYRLNSRRAILKASISAGFIVRELHMIEKEPSYGMSSRLLFLAFLGYERVVNSSEIFSQIRSNILGVLQKPDDKP
jgi:ubiquinone/menaquinone biosynthesis C-methylase UbiE